MKQTMALRIYSLNLAAFILLNISEEPFVELDNEGTVYFLFPENEQVKFLIQSYKSNRVAVNLKDYLNAFRRVRALVSSARLHRQGERV